MFLTKERYMELLLAGNRLATVEEHTQALGDLPPLPEWAELYPPSIVGVGEFRIDIPYDFDRLREIRKAIGSRWRLHRSRPPGSFRAYDYDHVSLPVKLELVMLPDMEGSTCECVKVGERTIDVYEVRCSDTEDAEDE